MKKILLFLLLTLGMYPVLEKGKLQMAVSTVKADSWGGEVGDEDPDPELEDAKDPILQTLSELLGKDIVGFFRDGTHTIFILKDGTLFNPTPVEITAQDIIDAFPDIFIPNSIEAEPDHWGDIEDVYDYLIEQTQTSDEETNAENNVTNECMKDLVQDVMDGDNAFTNILKTTFGTSSDFKLTFSQFNGSTHLDGKTDKTNNNIDIGLNFAALEHASQEFVTATIYHEIIHAQLGAMGVPGNQHHNIMADVWRPTIEAALMDAFPGLSQSDAAALAWGGLGSSTAWQNMVDDDIANNTGNSGNIDQKNKNHKNLNNEYNGNHGTQCP